MNNTAKQILTATAVVVLGAMLVGSKTLYDDHSRNTEHRLTSKQEILKLHDKLDVMLKNQTKLMNEQSTIKANQTFLIKKYEAEVLKSKK